MSRALFTRKPEPMKVELLKIGDVLSDFNLQFSGECIVG